MTTLAKIVFVLAAFSAAPAAKAQGQGDSILGFKLHPIQVNGFSDDAGQIPVSPSVLSMPGHFVWGGSVVQGDDGRYHMFFAYFDAGKNLPVFSDSWLLSSKIGYARSDYPDHGFQFIRMILGGAAEAGDPGAWDAQGVHNPHIKKLNGKYYLYYIGSRDPGERATGDPGAGLSKRDRIQQVQSVSVIAVDHLEDLINGNYIRPKSPLMVARTRVKPIPAIDPSPPGTIALPDNLIMVNPTVVYRPSDQKYLMYFKGNLYDAGWRGIHGVALADDPAGPFHPLDDFMFSLRTADGRLASAEDPYVWYHPGTELFYAIFKDFHGSFTGAAPGLAMMISPDGIHWELHPDRVFAPLLLPLSDGSSIPLANMERPQFLINEKGEPIAFYAACSIGPCSPKKDGSTFNAQFGISIFSARHKHSTR
jgi:hypothetical protein